MGKKFSKILRRWVKQTGLSREDAADRCEVTRQGFGNWLRGVTLPPPKAAERVARVLRRADLIDIIARDRAARRRSPQVRRRSTVQANAGGAA